uniref:Apolipoprotein C-IV n=1 Tax=Salmo trutta TaxID=8032 RepID=A0A674B579_SALTR
TYSYVSIAAQTPAPGDSDSEGVLHRATEAYRYKQTHKVVQAFAGAYYEDHIKPVADPYMDWVSASTSSFWDRVKEKMDHDGSDIYRLC